MRLSDRAGDRGRWLTAARGREGLGRVPRRLAGPVRALLEMAPPTPRDAGGSRGPQPAQACGSRGRARSRFPDQLQCGGRVVREAPQPAEACGSRGRARSRFPDAPMQLQRGAPQPAQRPVVREAGPWSRCPPRPCARSAAAADQNGVRSQRLDWLQPAERPSLQPQLSPRPQPWRPQT